MPLPMSPTLPHEACGSTRSARPRSGRGMPRSRWRGSYGKDAKRFVKAMKRIQSLLGEQHDTVAGRDRLRSLADQRWRRARTRLFTLGVRCTRAEEREGDELEAAFWPVWARAKKKRLRGWLS